MKALARVAAQDLAAPLNGLWRLLGGWVQGRQARLFERERRTTLQGVPPTLCAGSIIYDRRADGSVLLIAIPPGAPAVEVVAATVIEAAIETVVEAAIDAPE